MAQIIESQSKISEETIVIFDLSGSTYIKEKYGYKKGMHAIYSFVLLCHNIVTNHFDGHIVKDLGDGVLARFKDSMDACNAAICVNYATRKNMSITNENKKEEHLRSKSALFFGQIQEAKVLGKKDVFGLTVDLCSRIEKLTLGNQILLHKSVYEKTKKQLKNLDYIQIGRPMSTMIRGASKEHTLYEISHKDYPLFNNLAT